MKNVLIKTKTVFAAIFIALISPSIALAQIQEDVLLKIVSEELEREVAALKKTEFPPYYIGYRINDISYALIQTSFGSLIRSQQGQARMLTANIKVGDYELDDTHDNGHSSSRENATIIPLENEPAAIKQTIWKITEAGYKKALDDYKATKNDTENKKNDKKGIADFSKENSSNYFEPPLKEFDRLFKKEDWEEKLRSYSKTFLQYKDITAGDVSLLFIAERKYFISSEGTQIVQNMTYANLDVSSTVRTTDGDIVPLYKSYFAFSPSELPSSAEIHQDISTMILKLDALKKAPLAEPYTGPAILYPRSAGVFFHEIFGHRVEGHRLKSEQDGQTFKSKIKEQVLPKTMDVVFDPTMLNYNGQHLIGAYQYDDEGVKSSKVNVVEKGMLKNFLMSRTPLENFPNSNGHGRASAGFEAVSRQSNLIVETSKPVSMAELRKMLLKECHKQGKKYGYLFKDVLGGFTHTDRYSANVFNIMPTEVYRVYTDGRPDELVRGVDLIGTPLTMFAEIVAAGDQKEIFTGICGAESGDVPVSAVAPALFVRRIETQKKPTYEYDTTILSRPGTND